jgi:hypothetical protein
VAGFGSGLVYRVTLAPMPGGVPPLQRLRAALKALGRRYGLRCERVEELERQKPRSRPGAAP